MPDTNKIKIVPSLNGTCDKQLNFAFFNEENNLAELIHINKNELIRIIVRLVSICKDNNTLAEKALKNLNLIKKAIKSYKDFETIQEIEELIGYIFSDTRIYSEDFSNRTESFDDDEKILIKLAKLGVFND